jgi:hypothetical protein
MSEFGFREEEDIRVLRTRMGKMHNYAKCFPVFSGT